MNTLTFDNFEKIKIGRPVNRINYISEKCNDKNVLDLGSFDETAFNLKKDTGFWLFAKLEQVSKSLIGLDIALPTSELNFHRAKIIRKDVMELEANDFPNIDIITMGELIEHLENPLTILRFIKSQYPGKELIISTPNGLNFGNTLMGLLRKEVQHIDHLHVFSYKTLYTLCLKTGFEDWEIIPYHFFATELKLKTKSKFKKSFITFIEKTINIVEHFFPLLSMGYIVKIKI